MSHITLQPVIASLFEYPIQKEKVYLEKLELLRDNKLSPGEATTLLVLILQYSNTICVLGENESARLSFYYDRENGPKFISFLVNDSMVWDDAENTISSLVKEFSYEHNPDVLRALCSDDI